jgi:CBS-domain-containing membrane protein
MANDRSKENRNTATETTGEVAIELSDRDILNAMENIPGYLDVSTEDFKAIYRLAHAHAIERIHQGFRVLDFTRTDIEPLTTGQTLFQAASVLVRQNLKSLPVVRRDGKVAGVLSETDYLSRLRAETFLELFLRLIENREEFSLECRDTRVEEVMTESPVVIGGDADYRQAILAFRSHEGRSMPVVDSNGQLLGVLLRKEFIAACPVDGGR